MITLKDVERLGRLSRLATPGAMAYAAVFPLVQVALIAESSVAGPGGGYAEGAWALLATACFLPLHLRHVHYAVRGLRAPAGGWTLAMLTLVVVAAVPIGDFWLSTFHAVAVSALLVLRPRWSLPVLGLVLAAQIPLPLMLDSVVPAASSYYVVTVLWRTVAVFVPVWLIGAVQRLDEARQALADEAVVRERMRIDADLRETLGTALGSIVAQGQRAAALVGARGSLDAELGALVGGSRRTLAGLIERARVVSGSVRAGRLADGRFRLAVQVPDDKEQA